MKSSAHLEFVSFNCWKLQFSEALDFKLEEGKEYKIKVIALTGCGKDFKGGVVDEVGIKHLIEAFSKSGLKNSLKQLSITWWNVSKETTTNILKEFGMNNISVWA